MKRFSFVKRPTYFQKIGLKAMVAADTCWGQFQSHAKCGEASGLKKLNIQASDGAEKSTNFVRLAMAQNR